MCRPCATRSGLKPCLIGPYNENTEIQKQKPTLHLPTLLERVRPIHEVVKIDLFVPGCPPPADAIHFVVSELLAGRTPNPASVTRFGR